VTTSTTVNGNACEDCRDQARDGGGRCPAHRYLSEVFEMINEISADFGDSSRFTTNIAGETLAANYTERFGDSMEDEDPARSAAAHFTALGKNLLTALRSSEIVPTHRVARVVRILGFALQELSGNEVTDLDDTSNKLLSASEIIRSYLEAVGTKL